MGQINPMATQAMIRARLEAEIGMDVGGNISDVHIVRRGALRDAVKRVAFVQFSRPVFAQCAVELDGSVWPEIGGDRPIPISLAQRPKRVGLQDSALQPPPQRRKVASDPLRRPVPQGSWPKSMVLRRSVAAPDRQGQGQELGQQGQELGQQQGQELGQQGHQQGQELGQQQGHQQGQVDGSELPNIEDVIACARLIEANTTEQMSADTLLFRGAALIEMIKAGHDGAPDAGGAP